MLLPRRLDVNVQAEQAKSAEAPFANVDGGSEATTACFSRLLLLSLALQRRAGADFSTTDTQRKERTARWDYHSDLTRASTRT